MVKKVVAKQMFFTFGTVLIACIMFNTPWNKRVKQAVIQ